MADTVADLNANATAKAEIVEALGQALADTAVTTTLAQNYHWNVRGMAFGPLHDLFQRIYEDHFAGQDELAERIRALDATAPGTMAEFLKTSRVSEGDSGRTDREMIGDLLKAEETLSATLRGLSDVAGEHGEKLTEDLAIARGHLHEKFAWMLRTHLA